MKASWLILQAVSMVGGAKFGDQSTECDAE
jgi:hypothetical protein